MAARSRLAALLVGCAFFLSGVSALAFETLWFHQAGLAFGNSVWAASLTLSGFMAGLALGSALAARFADRAARPLHAYALIEAVLAASGVALVFVLPRLGIAFCGRGRGARGGAVGAERAAVVRCVRVARGACDGDGRDAAAA